MIDIKIGRKIVRTLKDKELAEKILEFESYKGVIDEYSKLLKDLKETISLKAKDLLKDKNEATLTFIVKDTCVKVTFGWNTSISDEKKLKEILADRFDDLVVTKVSYALSERLKEMSLDDDGIKECISVKEKAPAVTLAKV